mgnify:CR=1 FL=1
MARFAKYKKYAIKSLFLDIKRERNKFKMQNQFSRTELLIGKESIERLNNAKVAIFGIGGVGSFVVESLARAGVQFHKLLHQ